MKISLRSIAVMLGLLAVVSIMVPTQMQTQTFASTDEPDVLNIREVGNNGNNAEMAKMTVKEGNQPSQKEDDFELDPEENAIFVPQGKNVEVTDDESFFRAIVVQGDTDKQIPISAQGVIDLKGLSQGFYYLDVVIQDGNRKIAYEAILYVGDDNDTNRDTVNKEVNRVDKDVTITKRITNIDKTVVCGKDQKFNDKTKKCENIPPPCKPNEVRDKSGKCVPKPTKTPTPPPTDKPISPTDIPTPRQGTGPGGTNPACVPGKVIPGCVVVGPDPSGKGGLGQFPNAIGSGKPRCNDGLVDIVGLGGITCQPIPDKPVTPKPPGTIIPACPPGGSDVECIPGPPLPGQPIAPPKGQTPTPTPQGGGTPTPTPTKPLSPAINPNNLPPLCQPGQTSTPQNPCTKVVPQETPLPSPQPGQPPVDPSTLDLCKTDPEACIQPPPIDCRINAGAPECQPPAPGEPGPTPAQCAANPTFPGCKTPEKPLPTPQGPETEPTTPEPTPTETPTETPTDDERLFGPDTTTQAVPPVVEPDSHECDLNPDSPECKGEGPTPGGGGPGPGPSGPKEGDPCPLPQTGFYPNCQPPEPDTDTDTGTDTGPTPQPTVTPTPPEPEVDCSVTPDDPACVGPEPTEPPNCADFPNDPRCPTGPLTPAEELAPPTETQTCDDGSIISIEESCPEPEETQTCDDGSVIPADEECPDTAEDLAPTDDLTGFDEQTQQDDQEVEQEDEPEQDAEVSNEGESEGFSEGD